ncbi:MAG TPA: hydrogenase maturation protease [Candidatus Polarisedimenticolia bacterium]|nr:hydrogenase maturation protease [Candidatus Polarisedimenticolia bacterium]
MNEWEWQLLEAKQPVSDLRISDVEVRPGSRVKLRPRSGGDVMDIALAGKTAIIESIEQDYEGKIHLAVVVEEDPGRDIGLMRQPGHRFFFTPEEVEPLLPGADDKTGLDKLPRVLVAGIGNIFLGDDAFGVEVAKRLSTRALPETVRVTDFGTRGYDLAYALLDGYDTTILVDACPRGEPAGTLYVIAPDLRDLGGADEQPAAVEAHGMNPLNVLRLASSMGPLKRVLLVGCEPGTLGPEEGQMGLSEPIEAVIDDAVKMVESVIKTILSGDDLVTTTVNNTHH